MAGMLFSPGYPGFLRGVTSLGSGTGNPAKFRGHHREWSSGAPIAPDRNESEELAGGFVRPALRPSRAAPGRGRSWVAETRGRGRVLSIRPGKRRGAGVGTARSGWCRPSPPDGACLVTESRFGWSSWMAPGPCWTVCNGRRASSCSTQAGPTSSTRAPKELIAFDLDSGTRHQPSRRTCRSARPPGVTPKPLLGMAPFLRGRKGRFAGIAAGPDGTLYISADAGGQRAGVASRRSFPEGPPCQKPE